MLPCRYCEGEGCRRCEEEGQQRCDRFGCNQIAAGFNDDGDALCGDCLFDDATDDGQPDEAAEWRDFNPEC